MSSWMGRSMKDRRGASKAITIIIVVVVVFVLALCAAGYVEYENARYSEAHYLPGVDPSNALGYIVIGAAVEHETSGGYVIGQLTATSSAFGAPSSDSFWQWTSNLISPSTPQASDLRVVFSLPTNGATITETDPVGAFSNQTVQGVSGQETINACPVFTEPFVFGSAGSYYFTCELQQFENGAWTTIGSMAYTATVSATENLRRS